MLAPLSFHKVPKTLGSWFRGLNWAHSPEAEHHSCIESEGKTSEVDIFEISDHITALSYFVKYHLALFL